MEIRITERIGIDGTQNGSSAWVVVARDTRPAPRGIGGTPRPPQPTGAAMDYAGWHARLVGNSRRAWATPEPAATPVAEPTEYAASGDVGVTTGVVTDPLS